MTERKTTNQDSCGETDAATSDHDYSGRSATSDDEPQRTIISPVRERIGESSDNLTRREDWYRRRTGGA